jgi:hypothetical protein
MKLENDRKDPKGATPPTQKRRFRLEKLEDRIAPKKGGNGTRKCVSDGDGEGTGTSGY